MGAGCSQGTTVTSPQNDLDPRVPLTRTELEDIRAVWSYIKRKFEDTAKEMLIRFFRLHPYFLVMFPELRDMTDELEMRNSEYLEAQAMMMFSLFDDVIENLDGDLDLLLEKLEDVARLHAKLEGFHSEFFQYMEEPFIEALREKAWENFGNNEDVIFRKLFKWTEQTLSLEVEAIEYRLIPGD